MFKRTLCKLAHVVFGILTVISAFISFTLPIVFLLVFIIYELDEEKNIKDTAYEELREYGIGLSLGLLIAYLCKLVFLL